jgi:DNA-binding NtrC family response regulator
MTAALAYSTPAISRSQTIEKPCLLNLLTFGQDRALCQAYNEAASALGFSTSTAGTPDQMLHLIDSQKVDVVLLDVNPPVARAVDTLQQIKARRPEIEVIVATSDGIVDSAVQAMKAGAYDYLTKPFGLADLKLVLERVADRLKLKTEARMRCEQSKTSQGFGGIIGRTAEMEKLYRLISKASQSSHPVLIFGESGTGKEMVARAIHYSGPSRDRAFIPVDCGSLVPTLIESELFGYVKGAFTGAAQSKDGLLTIADGGTIFLDEIGELAKDLQTKLLRALQEKEIRPVGSTKSVQINVRILAATNRNLEQAVAQGSFRLDLFYRLNVLNLRVPPLRERRQDIPLLAEKFLEACSRCSGRTYELSEEAMRALVAHDWPGNVRELENCIERCCAMSSGPIIHSSDLPGFTSGFSAEPTTTGTDTRIMPLSEIEKQAILKTITLLNGDKMTAAKLLGIGKTTLYRKPKHYETEF